MNVQQLIEELQRLLDEGSLTPEALVNLEGCDCYGYLEGVTVATQNEVLLNRGK